VIRGVIPAAPVRYHGAMRWLVACLAIAGCARAGKDNVIVGGLIDAQPRVTLTQTASNEIVDRNSFGCLQSGFTRQNSYYRVFTLAAFGITQPLRISQVDFGIQQATAGQGAASQPATVRIGTYTGAPGTMLDLAEVHPISSTEIQIANIPTGSAAMMSVPIEAAIAPADSAIVELEIPDGFTQNNVFLVGTSTASETAPGYTLGADCGITPPTSMQSVADAKSFGTVHLIMTVTGTLGAVGDDPS